MNRLVNITLALDTLQSHYETAMTVDGKLRDEYLRRYVDFAPVWEAVFALDLDHVEKKKNASRNRRRNTGSDQ